MFRLFLVWCGSYINLADAGGSYDGSGTGQVNTGDWPVDYTRPQSLNAWAYTENDPINYTDPSGHFSIHQEVIIRYAAQYPGLIPEYTIPSTRKPPLWPGQRTGKRVDLANLSTRETWEVEKYSTSGYYPKGHGPGQAQDYADILNQGITDPTQQWQKGGYLRDLLFNSGIQKVHAWWDQPGLLVYTTQLDDERIKDAVREFCASWALAKLLQELKDRLPKPGPWLPGIVPLPPQPIGVPVLQ